MFLTHNQLVHLTGYMRPGKQVGWLLANRVPHMVSAAGLPVVAIREVERRLVQDPKIRSKDRPRLELVT